MNRPNDEQGRANTPTPESAPPTLRVRRGWSFRLGAAALILFIAVVGLGSAYLLKSPPQAAQQKGEPHGKGIFAQLFRDWGVPDFVVVLSAQQEGYMMPCGCSSPQIGGLERRYNFIQLLKKEKGWLVVAVDLGNVPQKDTPAKLPNVQGLIKYRYSMMALKEMGYLAAGIGENEAAGAWSLEKIEGEWAANEPRPAVLAGNLKDAENKFPFLKTAPETQTVPGTNIKVGVANIVGYSVANSIKGRSTARFNVPSTPSIQEQLKKMREEKVDLPILLYHGYVTGKEEALLCAQKFPDFPIILALSEVDEPPTAPKSVDHDNGIRNFVFGLGHKGKHIGVLGVYRNGPNFNFKYQLVRLTPDYETPEEQKANHPIAKKWEEYTRELKDKNYLKEYGQSMHVLQFMSAVEGLRKPGDGIPHYIGSEECASCHRHAYNVWSESKHSRAYKTLVEAKHPSLRQYDGECVVCHTIGFGYKTGFTNEKDTPDLINVGCESCHGPGSLHAANSKNKEWQERMNQPWRDARKKGNVKAKNEAIERFCVSCHDIDNDVTWVHELRFNPNLKKRVRYDPFFDKWVNGKIIHNNPPKK